MSGYVSVIKTAILIFPFVALVLSLPIFALQYRKNESFILWRAVVIYSFIFYLIAAYFLVILPLPDRSWVAQLTTPKWNITPFAFVREFIKYSPFVLADPSTYKATLLSPQFIQPTFNLLLTLPFGVYLRYYFNRSWWQVLLMGLGLSAFFELTQLSGLYGYYPRPYRLFDVDDLFLNTSGAVLGYFVSPILTKLFPTAAELEQREVKASTRVSLMRRVVAWIIDMGVLSALNTGVMIFVKNITFGSLISYLTVVFAYFVLLPFFWHGQTLGKWFVRIRLVDNDRDRLSFSRLLGRQMQLYLLIVPFIFIWTPKTLTATGTVPEAKLEAAYLLAVGSLIITAIFLISLVIPALQRAPRLVYEVIAKTRTVAVKKDRRNEQ